MEYTPPPKPSLQFSVRGLFWLTTILALLLLLGMRASESRYFEALSSPWTVISLAIIVLLGWLSLRRADTRRTRRLAIAAYATSLALPAFSLGGDLTFGFLAWLLSYLGITAVMFTVLHAFACLLGAIANTCFVLSILGRWMPFIRRRWPKLARRSSIIALVTSFAALVPIVFSRELNALYPGYGLWAGSFVMLYIATWREGRTEESVQIPRIGEG